MLLGQECSKLHLIFLLWTVVVSLYFNFKLQPRETGRTYYYYDTAELSFSDIKKHSSLDDCPCVTSYLKTLRKLGIRNGGGNLSTAEWKKALCVPAPPSNQISDKPIILGVGPGTTATRSFALAVSLLGKTTLHWGVVRTGTGDYHWEWKNKTVLDAFGANDLITGMGDRSKWESISTDYNFAKLFEPLDAIFDYPFPMYFMDIIKHFPQAKVIMTHRDPLEWYYKRKKYCGGRKSQLCSVPFLLRPLQSYMSTDTSDSDKAWTREKVAAAFSATEEVIQCTVGKERFLRVDAWNPPEPEGDWMPILAKFLDVTPLPTPRSKCRVPRNTDHDLRCADGETACRDCDSFFQQQNKNNSR